jgi:hypothetical protein
MTQITDCDVPSEPSLVLIDELVAAALALPPLVLARLLVIRANRINLTGHLLCLEIAVLPASGFLKNAKIADR